ncbi:MAG TPA: hypothetical protein VM327_04410 [Candidatus Thermoplasmatota archaeon]|nr:hypothetical protein [Candidatus Thermoplasmatota archaeon]
MLAMQLTPHPVDETMRVMDLQVTGADGEVRLRLPWDQTAQDLGPVLVARSTVPDDRKVAAYHAAPGGPVDLFGVPLGKALRSAANPDGAESIIIQVESAKGSLAFTVRCADVGEPQPHIAYPRGMDEQGKRLVDAYRSAEESDWFCDGSSTLACCDAARTEPEHQNWVPF